MKLNISKNKNKLIKNPRKYIAKIYSFNKIILFLENNNEFLDLWITNKFFARKKIESYDKNTSKEIYNKKFLKFLKHIISVPYGITHENNQNYIGNKSIMLFDISNKLPNSSELALIKIIGPGEIKDNILYAYDDIEYIFNTILNTTTTTYYYYDDWLTNEKYSKLEARYTSEIFNINDIKKEYNKKKNIYIGDVKWFTSDNKKNELASFPTRLLFLLFGLNMLKINGDLYLEYYSTIYKSSIQLLFIISTYFESYDFIKSPNYYNSLFGLYHFKNYKGNHELLSLLKDYKKLDDTYGKKYLKNKDLNLIYFDLNINIDKKFLEFIIKLNKQYINILKNRIKRCKYIRDELEKNEYFFFKIVKNNINNAIEYCKKFKLKINNYYKNNYYKLDNLKLKKKMFLDDNIDFNKLKINSVSLYSITIPKIAEVMTNIIIKHYPNIKVIADMNANIGGNSINFCKHFDFVYSIEIDKKTSMLLQNNLDVYKFKNFKVLNINCLDFEPYKNDMNSIKNKNNNVDLYFFDPPWTGILYKMNNNMNLYLDNKNIIDILPNNFAIKVPINYNIQDLLKKYKNLYIYNIKNYLLIINNIHDITL